MPSPRHSLVLLRITKLVPNPIYRGFARYFTPEHGIFSLYKPTFPTGVGPVRYTVGSSATIWS